MTVHIRAIFAMSVVASLGACASAPDYKEPNAQSTIESRTFVVSDSGACVAPASAGTFSATTHTGCSPSLLGCASGTAGYGLTCFGSEASPFPTLSCAVTPTPTNNPGYVSYCCPCP